MLGKEFDADADVIAARAKLHQPQDPHNIGKQLIRPQLTEEGKPETFRSNVDLGEQAAAEATAPGKIMDFADALTSARANPSAENVQASIKALRASNYRGVRPASLTELISGAHLLRAENELAKTTQIPKAVKKKTAAQIKAEEARDKEKARQLTSKGKREDIALTEAQALQKENEQRRPARTESVLARRDINKLNASIARIKADPVRLKALAVRLDKAHAAEEKRSEVRLAEFKNRLRRSKGDEAREKIEKLIKAEELKIKQAQRRRINAARMLTTARRRALKNKPQGPDVVKFPQQVRNQMAAAKAELDRQRKVADTATKAADDFDKKSAASFTSSAKQALTAKADAKRKIATKARGLADTAKKKFDALAKSVKKPKAVDGAGGGSTGAKPKPGKKVNLFAPPAKG
jgi:hypothetical protein